MLEELKSLGLAGPLLISVGSPDKLVRFLELNPTLPRDRVFVDASQNYEAYKAMNFLSLDSKMGARNLEGLTMTAPNLDAGTWFGYLTSVVTLSPIRAGEAGIPEGVTLLGGTFVLSGEQVVYASADRIPGDYPKPSDVLRRAKALV